MFQLTEEECNKFSRSQVGTLNGRGYNIKYLPYVFTEQGVAMLATILKTNVAEEVSISIMDAFVEMRKYDTISFGASYKDLGNKCFSITKVEDKEILNNLLKKNRSLNS